LKFALPTFRFFELLRRWFCVVGFADMLHHLAPFLFGEGVLFAFSPHRFLPPFLFLTHARHSQPT
jgi:hypothetical protein